MAKPTRIKSPAQIYVPQDKDAAAADIRTIGDLQRDQLRKQAEMNDEIAAVTAKYQPGLVEIGDKITKLQQGVQAWCEGHRAELTDDNKVKTANFITGEVQWRQRPPSVKVTGAEAVIAMLKMLRPDGTSLVRFVRTKEEVNKEAILNEPDAVNGVAGIKIEKGIEDFVITPFEQEVTA